jgi:alkaline phosphatase D
VDSSIAALAKWDNTIRNKVTGLQADTTYYYQFIAGSVYSKVGRFKTAPAATSTPDMLRFAFMTCQDWSVNHWGAFSEIVENESIDFIVHLGDYVYETVGASFQSGSVESLHPQLVFPNGMADPADSNTTCASTLADYRYLYKRYRTDTRLQAIHERYSFIAIWDDHEFSDDCWQDAETYDIGTYNSATGTGDNTHQTTRRRGANQAWYEFMPADVSFDESSTSYADIKLYRELQFGTLAHFVVTDERLYRADHIVPEALIGSSTGSRYMVPQSLRDTLEAAKISAAAGTTDTLAPVSMLGTTQRQWWKTTLAASPAIWKLWCNEVSLLRMGLNGTNAIATLLAMNALSTLASSITSTASSTGGDIALAGAIVAAVTAGASSSTAATAAVAIATAIAGGSSASAAAISAGLSSAQAGIAVATYSAAAASSGSTAQVTAAAQTIAFGYIKPDVQANGAASAFVIASGQATALSPYFRQFLLNCDQWDGYNAERKDLMSHISGNGIQNVVALTGDLHSFHAGTVSDNFDASSNGTPVMVDLVTAGISSDSWFSYFAAATSGSSLSTLIYYPISIPVTGLGTLSFNFNLFDFTVARTAPTLDALAEQARVRVRSGLAGLGAPESSLDTLTTAVLTALKADSSFSTTLLGLATQLAGLNNNPWIKYVNADAQGYAIVALSASSLTCTFRQLNRLVGTTAPSSNRIARSITATVTAGSAAVAISS